MLTAAVGGADCVRGLRLRGRDPRFLASCYMKAAYVSGSVSSDVPISL